MVCKVISVAVDHCSPSFNHCQIKRVYPKAVEHLPGHRGVGRKNCIRRWNLNLSPRRCPLRHGLFYSIDSRETPRRHEPAGSWSALVRRQRPPAETWRLPTLRRAVPKAWCRGICVIATADAKVAADGIFAPYRMTQPCAHLVNILSRRLANNCRSLLVNADGPPVYIPLARNVSMKSRMLSR